MSTFIIGDIQGEAKGFLDLLRLINFNPKKDILILLGDLINRGADNASVLNYILEYPENIKNVLGNHDTYFLYKALKGPPYEYFYDETLHDLFSDTKNLQKYIHFFQNSPLAISYKNSFCCHAGFWPRWSITSALNYSMEFSHFLKNAKTDVILKVLSFDHPISQEISGDHLNIKDPIKYFYQIRSIFTLIRYINSKGFLDHHCKLKPEQAAPELTFWAYELEKQNPNLSQKVFFGHFASLGLYSNPNKTIYCLDSGHVWGGPLSCFCLESEEIFQVTQK